MHKPPHSVSPAFRSRFAVGWNAELAISKRVIGIFRLRFACLQNSPFQRILTAETQRTRGCKTPETDTGCRRFRIKSSLPNGHVSTRFAPRRGVSAVKLPIDLSKSARNKRAKRPASDEDSSDRRSDKYQLTRNSQLSTFGLTFQICEMRRDGI